MSRLCGGWSRSVLLGSGDKEVGYCGSGILVVKLVCGATAQPKKAPAGTQHLRRKRF